MIFDWNIPNLSDYWKFSHEKYINNDGKFSFLAKILQRYFIIKKTVEITIVTRLMERSNNTTLLNSVAANSVSVNTEIWTVNQLYVYM